MFGKKKMKLNNDLTKNAEKFITQEADLLQSKIIELIGEDFTKSNDLTKLIASSLEAVSDITWEDCEDLYVKRMEATSPGSFSQFTREVTVDSEVIKKVVREVVESEYGLVKEEEKPKKK